MQKELQHITCRHYDFLCEEARRIRTEVFIKEQGFKEEFDAWDDKVIHVVIFADGNPAATGRLLPGDNTETYIIGRVAVLKKYRNLHLGSKIIQELERLCRSFGGKRTELSAQVRAQDFYIKLGYDSYGEIYMDEFCEHIHMEKEL